MSELHVVRRDRNSVKTEVGRPLGEDISKLGRRWDMENTNVTNNNPFPHEVEINLNMLCVLMLDRVGG